MREPLPVDPFIERIKVFLRSARALVVTAQPGAGKTTRVPPALIDDGPLILLQPRRVAARAIARRIADERGWTVGREIGWQIRFERRFTDATRLLVATEGVLTARLQRDPLLTDFHTVVIDEFHERSVHADVALALARQAWIARDDLRLVVMSATLDASAVSSFLGSCPVVDVPGRLYPLTIQYRPSGSVAAAAAEALQTNSGDVLCFLPGAAEIRRTMAELQPRIDDKQVELVPLHGSLDAGDQDRALAPSLARRRIVVATNIAETSITVPGITAVVDSGLHKVARYDGERGIDSLDIERIPADAAEQRAGRAGRLAPGMVWRLWDGHDRLRPHREPEIHRVDLSGTLLDIIAWGGDPRTLEWFDRPREGAIEAASVLLERLGALENSVLTPLGQRIHQLPLHPRLARMLIAAGGAREMARACALLSERHFFPARSATTTSDLLSALDEWPHALPHVQSVAREIEDLARRTGLDARAAPLDEAVFRQAVLAGYPDRVAARREPNSPRVLLSTGAGGMIGNESGVRDGEFIVAIDVQSGSGDAWHRGPRGAVTAPNDARVRVASRVEREWLRPTHTEVVHRFDAAAGIVRAERVNFYDALALAIHPVKPDGEIAATLLAQAWYERGPSAADEQLLRRLRFAGRAADVDALVRAAAIAARSLDDVQVGGALPFETVRALERDAPETLVVPSGRSVRLEYGEDGGVMASVKLQELFGLAETPVIGRSRLPVTFSLLAPNGRPVQITRDLRSFWQRTYPEVRKELRGRYPKHPWPEDPWNATPTARTKRRSE